MAQVIRKFAPGGKIGRFIQNGTVYTFDDENDARLSQIEAASPEAAATLRAGKDVTVEDFDDRIVATGIQSDQLTDRQKRRLGRKWSLFGGSDVRERREEVNRLSKLSFENQPSQSNLSVSPNPLIDMSDTLTLDYNTTDNGLELSQHEINNRIWNRLNRYTSLSDDKRYKFHNFSDIAAARSYIDTVKNVITSDDFKERVKTGNLTDNDISILQSLGVKAPSVEKAQQEIKDKREADVAKAKTTSLYSTFGLDPEKHYTYVIADNDRTDRMRVTDAYTAKYGDRNVFYNDTWYRRNPDPDSKWLHGYVKYGDYLYKMSDMLDENSELSQILNTEGGFRDLNAQNRFEEANSKIEYLHGDPDQSLEYNWNKYNEWMRQQAQKGGFRYRTLTGTVKLPEEGQQLIEYWTDEDGRDKWGRPKTYRYAIFDKYGKLIEDNVDLNKYPTISGGQQIGFNGLYNIIQDDSEYNNYYQQDYEGTDGTVFATVYRDVNDPNNMLLYMPSWTSNVLKDKAVRLDPEIAEILNRYPDFFKKLAESRAGQERFESLVRQGMTTGVGDFIKEGFVPDMTAANWMWFGFSEDDANNLKSLFDEWGSNEIDGVPRSAYERRSLRTLPKHVPSHQKGGAIRTAVADRDASSTTLHTVKDPRKAAGKGDDFISADWTQLGSLAMDISSLLTAIPTGGNPVSAALGVTGTGLQFVSDIKRDGFDWGDVGNAALGLGLDVVSALPGIGVMAKFGKLTKGVRKLDRIIRPILISAGIGGAVSSLDNIVSGNATLDDWRNLANGLMAVKGVGDTMAHRRTLKKYTTKNAKPRVVANKEFDDALNQLDDAVQRKTDIVKKVVNSNPDLKKHEGNYTHWVDENTGNVSDFEEAFKQLRASGHIKNDDILEQLKKTDKAKIFVQKVSNTAKDTKDNFADWMWPNAEKRVLRASVQPTQLTDREIRRLRAWGLRDNNAELANLSYNKQGGIIKAKEGQRVYAKQQEFDPKHAVDALRLTDALVRTDDAYDVLKKGTINAAYGQLKSMPTEYYERFSDNGLMASYQPRIDQIRLAKPTTSDANQTNAVRLMRDQYADQLIGERNAKMSQNISEFNNRQLATRRDYEEQRRQVADHNRSILGQLDNALAQVQANRISKKAQIWSQYGAQKSKDLAIDQYERTRALAAQHSSEAIAHYTQKVRDLWTEASNDYDRQSDEFKKSMTRYEFIEQQLAEIISQGQSWVQAQKDLSKYKFSLPRFAPTSKPILENDSTWNPVYRNYVPKQVVDTAVLREKKGGKVQRSFSEQAILDHAKDSRRAIQKMDDRLVKYILQMLKK